MSPPASALAKAAFSNVDVGDFFALPEPTVAPRVVLRAEASRVLRDDLVADVERFADAAAAMRAPMPTVEINHRHPESAAQELLGRMGVTEPSIRMGAVAKACGVRVLGWPLDEAVSGLLLDLDGGPAIGFNKSHPRNRRRFTVAHELGHYLLRHHEHFHVDLMEGTSQTGDPPGYDWQDEREANRFAAELLMPSHMVEAVHQTERDEVILARHFIVSPQAMSFRLANLDLI